MSNERLYEINGELLTLKQIAELCPDVNFHTLTSRVRAGIRDLDKLRAKASKPKRTHPWNR